MKKKTIILAGAVVMISALLVGCNKNTVVPEANGGSGTEEKISEQTVITSGEDEQESEVIDSENIEQGSEAADPGMMVGGWAVCEDNNSRLTDEEKEIFEDALSEMQGLDYEGLAVVATQVVSGTNRAYLAYGGEKDGAKGYAVIVVYSNLQGENVMNSLATIDPTDLHIQEPSNEKLMGGWEGVTSGKAWMLPSENAQDSFEQLFTEEEMRNPTALLNTQVVAGVNYLAMSVDKQGNVFLTKWYKDLNGNSQILEDGVLDMEYYTQNH